MTAQVRYGRRIIGAAHALDREPAASLTIGEVLGGIALAIVLCAVAFLWASLGGPR